MTEATKSNLTVTAYFALKAALIVAGIWIGIVTKCEHWLLLTIWGAVI